MESLIQQKGNVIHPSVKAYKNAVKQLYSDWEFFADIHLHSTRSDGLLSPEEIIKLSWKNNFYVAITDHNSIIPSSGLSKQHKERLIPAIEILCKDGVEFLAYFHSIRDLNTCFKKYLKPKISFIFKTSIEANWLISKLQKYNAVITVPHPYCPYDQFRENFIRYFAKKKLYRESIGSISNIEVFNASHNRQINDKCLEVAAHLKKGICAGSDAHTKNTLGSVLTYCNASSKEKFLEQFTKGNTLFIGTPTPKIKNVLPALKILSVYTKYFFMRN